MRTSIRAPWIHPVITGEDLARDVIDDFESFFEPKFAIKISLEIGDVDYAVTKGAGNGAKILISRDMANEIINSPTIFFFHLFIIGHEISHAVLMHNRGAYQELFVYRSLEMWADFYGAKIMMCLITYGQNLKSIFLSFFPYDKFLPSLVAMGQAAELLVNYVYRVDGHYPPPIVRVASITNGIISFFWREQVNLHPIWPYSIIKRITASKTVKELQILYGERLVEGFAMNEPARQWHINMQGLSKEIAPGLKIPIKIHLYSSFKQTKKEWERRCRGREDDLINMGLLKRLPSGDIELGPGPNV